MNKKLLLACLVISALSASARTLSPQDALSAALDGGNSGLRQAPARFHYDLARTFNNNDSTPAVYLFATENHNFIVTPADDIAETPMLAYGVEDIDNMPPSMEAWLKEYVREMEWLKSLPEDVAQNQIRKAIGEMDPIAPICKTKWGQDAPFFNDCPIMNHRHAATGCVATAMAQVMKVYRWPETGEGYKVHKWKYKNKTYTDSFDFENTTFDWDNMLDDYSQGYTPEQAQAVATLMHACGIASEMHYGPDGSGTMEYDAAHGLVELLRYDRSALLQYKDWYNADGWDRLIYNELALGRPVFYCGGDENGGHAFVCDGYSSKGFFHMNWGWNGTSDGYFVLSMLDPRSQGIGGNGSNFNFDQSVIIGLKPAEEGSKCTPIIAHENSFTPEEFSYVRNNKTNVTFKARTFNYAIDEISYDIAVGLKKDDGSLSTIFVAEDESFNVMSGFTTATVRTLAFPVGEYDVAMYYREVGTEQWMRVMHGINYITAWHFSVTDDKIEISNAQYEQTPVRNIFARIFEIDPTDPTDAEQFIIGHEYTTGCLVAANNNFDTKIATFLTRTNDHSTTVLAMSEPETVQFRDGNPNDLMQKLTIPANLEYGPAHFCVAEVGENNEMIRILTDQKVTLRKKYTEKSFNLVSIEPKNEGDEGSYYSGHTYIVTAIIESSTFDDGDCNLTFNDKDDTYLTRVWKDYSFPEEGGEIVFKAEITIPDWYEGTGFFAFNANGSRIARHPVTVTKPSGISDITDDTDENAEYFNLQGVRIYNPAPGDLVIRRTAKSSKVIRFTK